MPVLTIIVNIRSSSLYVQLMITFEYQYYPHLFYVQFNTLQFLIPIYFLAVFMPKKLEQFDTEKDEWYKQPRLYIDTKSLAYSLYEEGTEFKSFLSRDLSKKFVDGLDSLLDNGNSEKKERLKKHNGNGSDMGALLKSNGKIRKPVISFFSDKARVLREEIEKINQDMESRKVIHRETQQDVFADSKEIKRLLQEISLYSPGTKHSIDLRRIELEREMLGLRKELRISGLSLWKDIVMLRRELREIIFEYQALKRMAELVENGGGAHGVSG